MLDYTRASITKIRADLHKLSLIAAFSSQLLAMFSLLYILIKGEGIFAIKLTLLIVTAAYFVFYCATVYMTEHRHKQLKSKVKFAFQWSRRVIKVVNLAIVLYGFIGAEHTPFSLLMFTFSAFGVVLDVSLGLISFVVEGWVQLIIDGVEYDVEKTINAFKPATLFGKLLGKEQEAVELTANQKILDKIVQKEKLKKNIAKEEKREQKKEEKAMKKAEKKEAKAAKKKTQPIPTPDVLEETAASEE